MKSLGRWFPRGFLLLQAFMVSVASAGHAWAEDKPQESSTTVLVTSAAQACFSKAVAVTGFLVPKTPAIVTLDLEGFQVAEVFANEGDRVGIGQPLVRIARIAQENAQQQGRGQQSAAQQVGQSSFMLHAPAGGVVIKSNADVGTVFSAKGDPLFQIAVDNIIELDAEVPGLYFAEIEPGQAAKVTVEQTEIKGSRIRQVGGEISPVSHMGHVRIEVPPEVTLRVGAFAKATIDTKHSCGVSVPRSAVAHTSDGVSVQIVRGHIIETHRVRLGLHSDHDIEISEGVRLGDLVVAYAGSSLRDGDEVTTRLIDKQDQRRR